MRDNLPQKYKKNIFQSIIGKIKSFFSKEKIVEEKGINNTESEKNANEKENFVEQIKTEVNDKRLEQEKKDFMKKIEENPELLEEFSIDRLEKILQYYLEENEKKIKILNSLK